MDKFQILYDKFKNLNNRYLDWNNIKIIDESIIRPYADLVLPVNTSEHELKRKIAIIRLNGGLGTTLGCSGPKSLMEVKNGLNFLDIIIKQKKIQNYDDVQFYLMDSFYTHKQTAEYIRNRYSGSNIRTFEQSCYPRILKLTNEPLYGNVDHYYPPGHGDIVEALKNNKIIDELSEKGIEYLFVSNIDNLGATLNYQIINDLIVNKVDFAIELTKKTVQDVKGGTLINYNGRFKMFEIAECPPGMLDEFLSIDKFKYFNTNNIYIKVSALKALSETDYLKHVDLIVNPKKLKDGRECIQLEYAIGSLVKFFNKVQCYLVDRDRFIPVKNSDDLDNVRSNKYVLDSNYCLRIL
jgi:UTP--glucose-1-phosphate uridylyltransferase